MNTYDPTVVGGGAHRVAFMLTPSSYIDLYTKNILFRIKQSNKTCTANNLWAGLQISALSAAAVSPNFKKPDLVWLGFGFLHRPLSFDHDLSHYNLSFSWQLQRGICELQMEFTVAKQCQRAEVVHVHWCRWHQRAGDPLHSGSSHSPAGTTDSGCHLTSFRQLSVLYCSVIQVYFKK